MTTTCLGVGSLNVGTDPVGDEVCSLTPDSSTNDSAIILTTGYQKIYSERGIRWANAPGGKADLVVHGGPRVWHVNSVQTVQTLPASIERSGNYSGVIKFRFRSYKNFPVPLGLNNII